MTNFECVSVASCKQHFHHLNWQCVKLDEELMGARSVMSPVKAMSSKEYRKEQMKDFSADESHRFVVSRRQIVAENGLKQDLPFFTLAA